MEDNVKLYGDICALFDVKDESKRDKLWKLMENYYISNTDKAKTFYEVLDKFLEVKTYEGLSKNTVANYKMGLTQFIKWLGGDRLLTQVDKDDVRKYIIYMEEERKNQRTSIAQHLGMLKSFFNWCAAEGLIVKNPTGNIVVKCKKMTRHPLTHGEVDKIKAACTTIRDKALINFLLDSGCRVSEVVGITLDKISWDENTIRVFGKGSKWRTVMITDETKALLQEYLKTSPNKEYLFCCERAPYGQTNPFNIESNIREIGKKAGLEKSLYPHIFRHTFASFALEKGINIVTIQKLLGHDNLATTQIYAEMNMSKAFDEYREKM